MTIRVLLVDDQDLVRTGVRMILEAEPDLEVVGEAAMERKRSPEHDACGRTWC